MPAQGHHQSAALAAKLQAKTDAETRDELIERLARVEVDMDIIRRRMPTEVDSLEKLLNSVETINALGIKREKLKEKLNAR